MKVNGRIETWDILPVFGFEPTPSGLSINFGNFKLKAICGINMRFVDVVMCVGILKGKGSLADVEFEIPRRVESQEQCAAWIAWNLDSCADGGKFVPARETPWLEWGRENEHTLPWVQATMESQQKQEEFRRRPHCIVDREWLKLGLKTLFSHWESIQSEQPVQIQFDGKVLSFHVAARVVVMPAEGESWKSTYWIPRWRFRYRPKRLFDARPIVSIWRCGLLIDRDRYEGAVDRLEDLDTGAIEHAASPAVRGTGGDRDISKRDLAARLASWVLHLEDWPCELEDLRRATRLKSLPDLPKVEYTPEPGRSEEKAVEEQLRKFLFQAFDIIPMTASSLGELWQDVMRHLDPSET